VIITGKSCLAALANNREIYREVTEVAAAVMVARESSFLTVCHEVFLFRTGQCELRHLCNHKYHHKYSTPP